MQVKYRINFIILFCILIAAATVSCKKTKKTEDIKINENKSSQQQEDIVLNQQMTAQDLLSLGLAEMNVADKNVIPEYSYNKALGYFQQVVKLYPASFEAVEAQFNMAKFTEQKIKFLNLREISLRQKQGETLDTIKPFLVSYNQAINEYLEIYNKREYWNTFTPQQRERAKFLCTNALMQAAKLASDETNSKVDYGKAIDIYKIVYKEFRDYTNFGDLAIFSIVNIYYAQKEWPKVIEYGKIMEEMFPQSIYMVDVQNKVRRAQFNLK